MNQCVGGASVCTPLTCGTYCGEIGDGCGRKLTCNGCAAGRECRGGLCVDPGCVPITCAAANNVRYCGTVGDGCGGTLDCGTCPNGGTCGGTGYDPNVCNDPTCKKISCTPMGGQYCGVIGNGCGGTQDCGACANGMACATTGTSAHICPGSTTHDDADLHRRDQDDDQRHGLRPGRRQPALQRHRLHPERRACPRWPRASAATSAAPRSTRRSRRR